VAFGLQLARLRKLHRPFRLATSAISFSQKLAGCRAVVSALMAKA